MSLCCVKHIKDGMLLVPDAVATRLVATGKWLKVVNEPVKPQEMEIKNEEPIRQHAREGRIDCKQPSKKTRS